MTRYDLLYFAAIPLVAPLFLYKYFVKGKYHDSFAGMFGFRLPNPPIDNPSEKRPTRIWVHAVSVGETVAARSVILPLREALPEARFMVSTVTETGQATAKRILGDIVEDIFYYPIDLSRNVDRFLDAYRPDVFIMMETELWPNMLNRAGARGVRIFTLNGKLSDRSFPWYQRFRFLFNKPLSNILACAVQTPVDAERLAQLCAPATRIEVTGNCKFDIPDETMSPEEKNKFRKKYRLSPNRTVVVAGSTHPGEEDIVLQAWRETLKAHPDSTLILAPRHPERFREVAGALKNSGLTWSRSAEPSVDDPQVLLLDEMGVLSKIYGIAAVGIVCGSFVYIGGHNLLEVATHSIPVVYGPHMHKQKELLRLIGGDNGGVQIDAAELAPALIDLLADPKIREDLGQAARRAVEANRGSARRSIDLILPLIQDR